MVMQNWFIRLILGFSVLCALPALAQGVPSPEEIGLAARDVLSGLEGFKTSRTEARLNALKTNVEKFKGLIERTGSAIDWDEGGAATPKAVAAAETIAKLGTDIELALFAERSEMPESTNGELKKGFEDTLVNLISYPLLELAFDVLRTRVDERSNVDGVVTWADVFRRGANDVRRNLTDPFLNGHNRATGEAFNYFMENIRREKLVRALAPLLEQKQIEMLPEINRRFDGDVVYNRENYVERLGGLLIWLTDRATNIRVERNSAQLYATGLFTLAGVLISQPYSNFLGDSYSAPLESMMILAAASAGVILVKIAASSVRSTNLWIKFSDDVRAQMNARLVESSEKHLREVSPKEYYPANVPGWLRTRLYLHNLRVAAWTNLVGVCNRMLGKGATPQH